MKVCSECQQRKDFNEFYVRRRGKRAGQYYNYCKECMRIRGKKYYQLHHARQLELATRRNRQKRKALRLFVDSLKTKPCADCGQIFPPFVMDFDHRDSKEKEDNIGTLISQTSLTKEKLLMEIDKCDLVCANCHRIRTYNRQHQQLS